jgi:hypothetical protein
MFMNHSMAEGGFLPVHDKVPHALWFFLRESHKILVNVTRQVIYEIDGVREGKTEEQILHELFLKPAKATADLYGVTLDQMFAMPVVRLCISEVQRVTLKAGTFTTDGFDPRILGWIESGGKENFVPRVASYWFSESGS